MPMLTPTTYKAKIVFLGVNDTGEDLCTTQTSQVMVDYDGFEGDSHSGLTRPSCVRVRSQYPKGTEIRNTRQISALSQEELSAIATTMQIESIHPTWVGANLLLAGIPGFSKVPPSSRLIADNGTSLVVDMENAPCKFPGEIIDRYHPGVGSRFPSAAVGKRGTTLWVEKTGTLNEGDHLTLHVPPRCSWQSEFL